MDKYFSFVTGLLAFIFLLVNGVLQYFVIKPPDGSPQVGIILFQLAYFPILFSGEFGCTAKKMAALPFDKLQNIAVIDFTTNNVLNNQQQILAPVHEVYLQA